MFNSLSGQKVVIIGISSGLDLAIAEHLITVGAKVVLTHSDPAKLQQAIESISDEIESQIVDIGDENSVNTCFEQIGKFDHLVVTSMGDRNLPRSLLAEMSTATAEGAMAKFWVAFFAVRAALNGIAPNGSITLISSISMFKSSKLGGISAVAAANAAVAVFGRTLSLEIAPIRVNAIAAGLLEDTSIWSNQAESERSSLTEWARSALPVEHLGQPAEIAQAVLGMMTNSYLTGAILPVDGGVIML